MKIRPFILSLLGLALLVGPSCRKKEPCNCPYPAEDKVEASHYWVLRNKLGDTLRFNVYRVETVDSHHIYHYIGEETFIGTDSIQETLMDEVGIQQGAESGCPCTESYNRQQLGVNFKGNKYNLKQMIKAFGSFDILRIVIAGRDYQMFTYGFSDSPHYSRYQIENKTYSDVYRLNGFLYTALGNDLHEDRDSTFAYYNYQDGLIKVIVNGNLAFLRKP